MSRPELSHPIESYLAELRSPLRVLPSDAVERIVDEVRDHLLDAAAAEQRAGRSAAEASTVAVERFGPARAVAERFTLELRAPTFLARVAIGVALACCLLDAPLYFLAPAAENLVPSGLAAVALAIALTRRRYLRAGGAAWFAPTANGLGWRIRSRGGFFVVAAAVGSIAASLVALVDLQDTLPLIALCLATVVHVIHATAGERAPTAR